MSSALRLIAALAAGAACLACAAPVPLHAQARGGTEDLADLTLEELMDIPVYAASRRVQSVSEAPASVTIITAREIKTYGWRCLGDILHSVAGIYTTNDRSYQYVGVRGFGRPGDWNSRILLLVDGVRTNENIYDSAGIGYDFNLDIDLVDRIEIVRGPGSVLYGTNAVFAVVNVITKTGADIENAEIAVVGQSASTYAGRLSFGKHLADNRDILVSGSWFGARGEDLYYPEFDDPGTNNGIAEGRDGETAGSIFAKMRLGPAALSLSYVDRTKDRPTASYGAAFNNPCDQDTDKRLGASLSYERLLANGFAVMAQATFLDYRYDGDFAIDHAPAGEPPDIVVNQDRVHGQLLGSELRISGTPLPRNRITVGVEYRDNFTLEQRNADEGAEAPYLVNDMSSRVVGVYVQDEIRVADRVIVNAGARYDHTSPLDEGKMSPRTGLIITPLGGTTLKLLYGEAFRTPNTFELYYHDGGLTSKGNPDLDPEKIRTLEVVLDREISSHLHAVISAYHYRICHLIGMAVDPADGLLQYRNIDEVEANGFEIAILGEVPGVIAGRVSYSYADARDSATDEWLTNSPRSMAKVNLMSPFLRRKFRAGFQVHYVGECRTLAGDLADSYLVTSANLLAVEAFPGLEISAAVYNLFDERYAYPAGDQNEQNVLEADGRAFRIKCTYGF